MAKRLYSDHWVKKAKWLTQALIVSSTLNVGLLCTFIYSAVKKEGWHPLAGKAHATHLADLSAEKNFQELFTSYSNLSFQDLLLKLTNTEHIEAGYTRRDLALACLTSFHHFNLEGALGGWILEKRQISFRHKGGNEMLTLDIYPGLANYQYQAIIHYAKTEKWPLTPQGLFCQIQSACPSYDPSLLEAFYLTGEFHFMQLLFSKTGVDLKKEHLVTLLSQTNWFTLHEVAEHLRQNSNFTLSGRRHFLLQLLSERSKLAAKILVETDRNYCVKNLDNDTVISLCNLLGDCASPTFLKNLLESPRPDAVWKKAATILYEQAAEEIPDTLDLDISKRRFIELKSDMPPSRRKAKTYTVISGDSLWRIARAQSTTVAKLREDNDLKGDNLKIGQTLTISR